MKRTVLLLFLCSYGSCYSAASIAESVAAERVPSLGSLAWNTFKKNAERYRSIPIELRMIIDCELEKHESLEGDPFAFLRLADQLQADDQKDRAAKYIAMQLFQRAPGRQRWANQAHLTNEFQMSYTDLFQQVESLPEHLKQLVRKLRNSINDVTGQFPMEAP